MRAAHCAGFEFDGSRPVDGCEAEPDLVSLTNLLEPLHQSVVAGPAQYDVSAVERDGDMSEGTAATVGGQVANA